MITRACPEGHDYSQPCDWVGLGPTAERADARWVALKGSQPGIASKRPSQQGFSPGRSILMRLVCLACCSGCPYPGKWGSSPGWKRAAKYT